MTTKNAEEMAAEKYGKEVYRGSLGDHYEKESNSGYAEQGFLAGAAWQRERDAEICREQAEIYRNNGESAPGTLKDEYRFAVCCMDYVEGRIRAQGEK